MALISISLHIWQVMGKSNSWICFVKMSRKKRGSSDKVSLPPYIIFFSCPYSGQIWTRVPDRFQMNRSPAGWSSELYWAAQNLKCASFGNNLYKLVMSAVVYHVWGERIAWIFSNRSRDQETVFRGIEWY